ncbi:hypothetical protein AAMO2058_000075600 [Amorphochlora amoebiformis]
MPRLKPRGMLTRKRANRSSITPRDTSKRRKRSADVQKASPRRRKPARQISSTVTSTKTRRQIAEDDFIPNKFQSARSSRKSRPSGKALGFSARDDDWDNTSPDEMHLVSPSLERTSKSIKTPRSKRSVETPRRNRLGTGRRAGEIRKSESSRRKSPTPRKSPRVRGYAENNEEEMRETHATRSLRRKSDTRKSKLSQYLDDDIQDGAAGDDFIDKNILLPDHPQQKPSMTKKAPQKSCWLSTDSLEGEYQEDDVHQGSHRLGRGQSRDQRYVSTRFDSRRIPNISGIPYESQKIPDIAEIPYEEGIQDIKHSVEPRPRVRKRRLSNVIHRDVKGSPPSVRRDVKGSLSSFRRSNVSVVETKDPFQSSTKWSCGMSSSIFNSFASMFFVLCVVGVLGIAVSQNEESFKRRLSSVKESVRSSAHSISRSTASLTSFRFGKGFCDTGRRRRNCLECPKNGRCTNGVLHCDPCYYRGIWEWNKCLPNPKCSKLLNEIEKEALKIIEEAAADSRCRYEPRHSRAKNGQIARNSLRDMLEAKFKSKMEKTGIPSGRLEKTLNDIARMNGILMANGVFKAIDEHRISLRYPLGCSLRIKVRDTARIVLEYSIYYVGDNFWWLIPAALMLGIFATRKYRQWRIGNLADKIRFELEGFDGFLTVEDLRTQLWNGDNSVFDRAIMKLREDCPMVLDQERCIQGIQRRCLSWPRRSPERPRFSPERRRFSSERRRFSPERRRFSPERRRFSPDPPRFSPEASRLTGYSLDSAYYPAPTNRPTREYEY